MHPIPGSVRDLWRGCILATITHAFAQSQQPFLMGKRTWDVYGYSITNGMGSYGTICFPRGPDDLPNRCVGGFWDPEVERADTPQSTGPVYAGLFNSVSAQDRPFGELLLRYLEVEYRGSRTSRMTTVIWGQDDLLQSPDSWVNFLSNGGHLVEQQFLDPRETIRAWRDSSNALDSVVTLAHDLWQRRISNPPAPIFLRPTELELVQSLAASDEAFHRCSEGLNSLNIWLYPEEE